MVRKDGLVWKGENYFDSLVIGNEELEYEFFLKERWNGWIRGFLVVGIK